MKKLYLLSLSLFVVFSLSSQNLNNEFRLQYDVSRFRGDDAHLYVEVYYSFDVSSLKYIPKGKELSSEAVVSVTFQRSSDDSIVAKQAWRIPFSVTDTTMLQSSRSYTDVFGFFLKPGTYKIYLNANDMNDQTRRDSIVSNIDLKAIGTETITLSDVELSTSIQQIEKDSTNRFYKNTLEVKPNASKVFGNHQPVLFYYLEAYNLKKKQSEYYHTRAIITNSVGKEVVNHEKPKRRSNDSNVEVGMMKVNALRTGAYTFSYYIVDSIDNSLYSSSKRFFIFNPTLPNDTLVNTAIGSVDASEYAAMSEAEVDKEFELSKYVAAKNEIDQYKKLKGIEAKRKAMFDFWLTRDEDRSTPTNEQKQEYFRRVNFANAQYKTGFREGWKTDRGRVHIMYGTPDEVERHANEIDVKPYEIWYYNSIQGGVQFIFGDRTGFSDYILLHSTHRNELRDENWRRQILAN